MTQRLIIVGAGAQGREALVYAHDCRRAGAEYSIGGFLDDNPDALQGYHLEQGILGDLDYAPRSEDVFVIAVGEPYKRAEMMTRLESRGGAFVSLVHPAAFVAPNAQVGVGCLVAPFAFIGANAVVGANVLLNVHAVIGHDARVGEHCVLSPGASASGFSALGPLVFMGTNAVVVPGKVVGEGSQVTAGSVVYNEVEARHMALGNPARCRRLTTPGSE